MQKRKQLIETLQQRRPRDENMSTRDESQVICDSMESTFLILRFIGDNELARRPLQRALFEQTHLAAHDTDFQVIKDQPVGDDVGEGGFLDDDRIDSCLR